MDDSLRFEELDEGLHLCVSKTHRFSTDAVLLADFAATRAAAPLACDLCTGCGVIPMLLAKSGRVKTVYGIDIQPEAIDQFTRGVAASSTPVDLIPVLADLRELPTDLPLGQFHLVCANPPFQTVGSGFLSREAAFQIARHETLCSISDVTAAAGKLLRYGGRLCLCQRPERLTDTLCAMRQSGIEPKRLRFVAKNRETKPWLFLIEGKKGGKPGLSVEPLTLLWEKN